MPSMNRSMSVPDTGPMWDMHTSASQSSGTAAAEMLYDANRTTKMETVTVFLPTQAVKPVFGT